jgi:hypothetical protein
MMQLQNEYYTFELRSLCNSFYFMNFIEGIPDSTFISLMENEIEAIQNSDDSENREEAYNLVWSCIHLKYD